MSNLLATRFKNRRIELNLSQAEVAEGICKQGRISMIEKGNYSPGSELLYQLSKKLDVTLDYFFNEDIVVETTNLEKFKDVVQKMLIQRDYIGLKYVYEFEKEKKQKLSVQDQMYLKWIETMILFYTDKEEKKAIKIISELIKKVSQKDMLYLRLNNTLLNFYVDSNDSESYVSRYTVFSKEIEHLSISNFEEIELLIMIKYNFCRYLCVQNDSGALNEVLETIELCKKFKTITCLADLSCLLGHLGENFMDEERIKKYYKRALMLYEFEGNEKEGLSLEKYILNKFGKSL